MCAAPGEGLATPVGKEIATVLLKVLLPNPAYCQRATVVAFQGLFAVAGAGWVAGRVCVVQRVVWDWPVC